MNIVKTAIDGVVIIEPAVFGDERGFFQESWNKSTFGEYGLPTEFVQDNHSRSAQGILRGLHYQTRHTQGKLVRVTAGSVYDVVVDLRPGSSTWGHWVGVELSDANHRMLWVPEQFAHGFYVLSESADFLYKCTDYYAPDYEQSIRWDDPDISIDWPLVEGQPPTVSEKDRNGVTLTDAPGFA